MKAVVGSAEDFLIARSYRKYPQDFEYPYLIKNLYQHQLTDLETQAVCETNDRLCINIEEHQFIEGPIQYSIDIRAERHGVWWDLKCYALSNTELVQKIEYLENTLIKVFNSL